MLRWTQLYSGRKCTGLQSLTIPVLCRERINKAKLQLGGIIYRNVKSICWKQYSGSSKKINLVHVQIPILWLPSVPPITLEKELSQMGRLLHNLSDRKGAQEAARSTVALDDALKHFRTFFIGSQ